MRREEEVATEGSDHVGKGDSVLPADSGESMAHESATSPQEQRNSGTNWSAVAGGCPLSTRPQAPPACRWTSPQEKQADNGQQVKGGGPRVWR